MDINISFHIPVSPIIIILGIVVVVNLALAWRTYISNRKHPVNRLFALVVLMGALWTLAVAVARGLDKPTYISLAVRFSYFFGALVPFFFYFFSYYFPYKTYKLSIKTVVILSGCIIFISIITFLPDVLIAKEFELIDRYKPEVSMFWQWIFTIYLTGLSILSFRNLFSKYKICDGIWRKRLRQVLVATLVAFGGGLLFGIIIPVIHNSSLLWIAPLFTFFTAAYIWYHIFWTKRISIRDK